MTHLGEFGAVEGVGGTGSPAHTLLEDIPFRYMNVIVCVRAYTLYVLSHIRCGMLCVLPKSVCCVVGILIISSPLILSLICSVARRSLAT